MRWFEDFTPGEILDLGTRVVTREEIVAFAAEYDPQPMHMDEEAARATMLGGLGASGWHTCALLMRFVYDGVLRHAASMGSPGIDEVKWLRPVRPGDVLAARGEVTAARPSSSRPEMGIVTFRFTMTDGEGQDVLVQDNPILFARRPDAEARP